MRKIAVLFNVEGLPSPTGKQWNNITVKKILKQEKYIGDIRWQKTYGVFMGEQWKINNGEVDSFYIENAHPAIIDRETFFIAQKIREEAAEKSKPKNEIADRLFRGRIKCTCGRSYYRISAKNDYWECTGRRMLGGNCDNYIFYHEELINAWKRMCRKLREHADEILTPIVIQLEMMKETMHRTEIASLKERADDIQQRRYMLSKLCTEGCIDREDFMSAENEMNSELDEITSRIEKNSIYTDDTAERIEMIYRAVNTTIPERLVNMILEYAEINGRNIIFHLIGGLYFREVL